MKFDFTGKSTAGLRDKKLFLFDMDGTIYIDGKLFDGIKELFDRITATGGKYVFITNNSSKSRKERAAYLNGLGIPAREDNFMTSTMAAVSILKKRFGGEKIYVQATASCVKELKNGGLNVTEDYDESVAAILVGFDTELTFEKMDRTCKMLTRTDVPYYATNPDWCCPVDYGYCPDCGSMCFGYEKSTGKKPIVIGKPNPFMIDVCVENYGYTREQTLVIGDRIYTDIASGVNAKTDTLLVLSGECTVKDLEESDIKPTFVLKNASDLNGIIR
ncbi:MAG: HAD-IIA family hydrolase [Clostridia bacterium]|nr:HAD-IIA family hydrolase [Clostridia bacterium]